MGNRPYEQDDGLASNIAMTGILAGGAYTAYKVYREPEGWFSDKLTTAQNKIFPENKIPMSTIQSKVDDTFNRINKNMDFARRRKEATYSAREESLTRTVNKIEGVAKVDTLNLNHDVIGRFKTHGKLDITGLTINESDIGKDVLDSILGGLKERMGLHSTPTYTFRGTDTILNVGGEEIVLPTSKYVPELDAYISKRGTNFNVVQRVSNISGADGKIVGNEIVDPNRHLADMLSSDESAIFAANDYKTARDMRELVKKKLDKIADKVTAENGVRDFHEIWNVKTMFKKFENSFQYFSHNDLGKAQFLGKQVRINPYSLFKASEEGGLRGIDNAQISLNSASRFINGAGNSTDAASIDELMRLPQGIRSGKIKTTYRVNPVDRVASTFEENVGYTLGQTPSAEGTMSYLGVHTLNREVDSLKSMKGYRFVRPMNKVTTHEPIIWNPKLEEQSPYAYTQFREKGRFNALTVLDNNMAEEMIELTSPTSRRMRVSSPTSIKVKKFIFGSELPSEEEAKVLADSRLKYFVDEGGKRLKKYGTLGDIVKQINEGKLDGFEYAEASSNAILGFNDVTGQVDGAESLDTLLGRKLTPEKAGRRLRFYKDDIGRIVQDEQGTFSIPGHILGDPTKVGVDVAKTRAAVGVTSYSEMKSLSEKYKMSHVPHARASRDFYKKTLLDGDSAGKNLGEMLTFLQQSIVGHVAGYGMDVNITGSLKDEFSKTLAHPDQFNGSLLDLFESGNMQFLQGEGQLGTMQKVLGGIRQGVNRGSRNIDLDGRASVDDAARYLSADFGGNFNNANPWLSMMGLSPHEDITTQGLNNIYKVDMKSMPYLSPELMEELSTRSLTDTTKLMSEFKMMMNPELRPEALAEHGLPILDGDGLDKLMGNINTSSVVSDIKDRHLIPGTFLSKEANPNGFALKRENGGLVSFGSAEFMGGGHWLEKDESLAWQGFVNNESRIIARAAQRGGVVSEEDYNKLMLDRVRENTSSKAGALKRTALAVEGGFYDINIGSSNFVNNKEWIGRLYEGKGKSLDGVAGIEEFKQLFGHTGLIDRRLYQSDVRGRLDDIVTMAKKDSSRTPYQIMQEQFGEGSDFEKYIKKTSVIDDIDPVKIAQEITDRSVSKGKELQKKVDQLMAGGASAEEANELIKGFGHPTMTHRYPNVSTHSRGLSFMFASEEDFGVVRDANGNIAGRESRSVALGHLDRITKNADNDGDKIFTLMTYRKEMRMATAREIKGNQAIVADYMQMFKDKDLVSKLYPASKAAYTFPGQAHLASIESTIKELEVSSAKAAFMTKALTGSAHVKANEIRNAMLETIDKSGVTGNALSHALGFMNQPGQQIEQTVISSKDLQAVLKTSGESGLHNIVTAMSNIGNVTKESFIQTIAASKGSVGALQMAAAGKGIKDSHAPWLTKGNKDGIYDQWQTLMNINTNYRRTTQSEFESLHPLLGSNENTGEAWKRFDAEQNNIKFLKDRPELQKSGLATHDNYLDMIDHFEKQKLTRNHNSADAVLQAAEQIVKTGSAKGATEAEKISMFVTEASKIAMDPSYMDSAAQASLVGNSLRGSMAQKTERNLIFMEDIKKFMGKITPGKVAGGLGIGMIAMTAMNLFSGDGTPEDINELPSVSNPSFGGAHRGSIASPRMISSSMGNNMSMGLLTDRRSDYNETMQSISAMFGGRLNNNVSIRSDGTDPYKSDMYQYRG